MAYRRRVRFRRRARRAPWYRRKYNAVQLASKALKGVRYIRGLVNSEMLHKHNSGAVTINSTGTVIPLANISQGDTDAGRTGNSIFARNLLLNLDTKVNASNTGVNFLKIMLVQDNQQVGDTTPAVTDILLGAYPNSPLNNATFGRFTILKNWKFSLDMASRPAYMISKYKKLYHHIRYNGTADTDIQRGGLYLLFISDQSTNAPSCDYQIRLGYHDN